MNPDTKLGVHC